MKHLIDFGLQPVCNRFSSSAAEPQQLYPLRLSLNEATGLIMLDRHADAEALRPRVDWITYKEPENHLDQAAKDIVSVVRPDRKAQILGLSYKDASLLRRLSAFGLCCGSIVDPVADLEIAMPGAGLETIQAAISGGKTALASSGRRFDLIVARHLLEHAHAPEAFCERISDLLNIAGTVVFEVPDFSGSLEHGEYTTIWEEHISYFSPATLRRFLESLGFSILALNTYRQPMENCLVAIARPEKGNNAPTLAGHEDVQAAAAYAANFVQKKDRIRKLLADLKNSGRIAIFGAGHHAAKFINFFEIADLIDFVADDDPNKLARFMPGSNLPIKGSAEILNAADLRWCLVAVGAESEPTILSRFSVLKQRGGGTYSIFFSSPHPLPVAP